MTDALLQKACNGSRDGLSSESEAWIVEREVDRQQCSASSESARTGENLSKI